MSYSPSEFLVNSPANGRAGHGRDDAGTGAAQETAPAELPLDDGRGVEQPLGRSNFLVLRQTPGLQQSLHHVQWRGDSGSHGARQTTGDAVREGVIILRRVHDLGNRLVGDKLRRGEGDGHAQSGGVGDVERLETFGPVD